MVFKVLFVRGWRLSVDLHDVKCNVYYMLCHIADSTWKKFV